MDTGQVVYKVDEQTVYILFKFEIRRDVTRGRLHISGELP